MHNYKIKYGNRERRQWHLFTSLQDPTIQSTLQRLISLDWDQYVPWIVGSALSNVETWDIDLIFEGPYTNKSKINELLQQIADISFEEGVFIDAKYLIAGEIKNITEWVESGKKHTMHFAIAEQWVTINDRKTRCAIPVNGLNRIVRNIPFSKDIGKVHNDPIKLDFNKILTF